MGSGGTEHFDVVIVGAGISGIGAACHLEAKCPDHSFVILEGRDDIGGTWDLFRYPGVRSDSDMHTLGYEFKPWTSEKSIADGPSIMEYLRETVAEHGLGEHIRFRHLVRRAEWSTEDQRWTVVCDGDGRIFTCGFLFVCAGYYSYRSGHVPEFAGRENFRGEVVHPQEWPEDLDYAGKSVVIIGSGATAMTLVPAMARTASHVTMLQRSPTYVVARPDVDKLANRLRRILPSKAAYAVTRWKNTTLQQLVYLQTRKKPGRVRERLLKEVREHLGPDFDVDTHFSPTYDPWDQRLCLLPNGDLFEALTDGRASIVTDTVERFDERGVVLGSGGRIDADVIVTATGLELVTLGEAEIVVDGETVDFSRTFTYKGFAYSGVPNLATTFGYVNASWTLRADLVAHYVCRMLSYMRETGTTQCTPVLRAGDHGMQERPWIDGFSPNYMTRVMHRFPRQGDREPWVNPQNYKRDRRMFRDDPVDDGVMTFTRRSSSGAERDMEAGVRR